MSNEAIAHAFEGETLSSEYYPVDEPRASIVIFPTVVGISSLEQCFAKDLNGKGFNVFLADLYGEEFRGCDRETGALQMRRVAANRAALRRRLLAVLDVVSGLGNNGAGTVCVGFCFGGQCALDVARSGADIAGVASFHGIFDPPPVLKTEPIKARVIAFHGWDDPMVPPAKVVALANELTRASADWQILAFGNTRHAFTNPGADVLPNPSVAYSKTANDRAWRAFHDFMSELFPDDG